ncbi:MAG: hypothetical protein E7655_00780 [Ruminococcaceae bacterium]|nr:hypothetical protein [Oscillospiraceae bacterium]
MKKTNRLFLCTLLLPIAAIVLELLPFGVVLHFGQPDGESLPSYFSHFDLTPYGYANFGPFLTALLSCLLLAVILLSLLIRKRFPRRASLILSAIGTLTSLMPATFGLRSLTPVGLCVTALMAAEFVLLLLQKEKQA